MAEKSLEPNERIYRSRKEMLVNNFLGGIAWSLGTLIGASVVIGIIGFFLSRVDLIPIIGSWLAQLIDATNITDTVRTR